MRSLAPSLVSLSRTFVAVLLAFATIVGLYFAAAALRLEMIFWFVVGAALLVSIVVVARKPVRSLVVAWRDYPGQLRKVASLEHRVRQLRNELDVARADIQSAVDDGIAEGHAQARGAFLATISGIPGVIGIAERDGAVNLVGSIPSTGLRMGARYRVVVKLTGQLRGVVQVSELDETRNICFLACVDATNEPFWKALSEQVIADDRPPLGVVLEAFSLAEPSPVIDGTVQQSIEQEKDK